MDRTSTRGFTLVELAITLVVLGLLFAFSAPALQGISATNQLKGATENIAAQLRMAREKAIATGVAQPMHFTYNWLGSDYHIHYADGTVGANWKLPRGITYYSVTVHPTMKTDGSADASGNIILQDSRGLRDTVAVLVSGLILTK
jgi:type IV fimbrial biogenesis protein FimT